MGDEQLVRPSLLDCNDIESVEAEVVTERQGGFWVGAGRCTAGDDVNSSEPVAATLALASRKPVKSNHTYVHMQYWRLHLYCHRISVSKSRTIFSPFGLPQVGDQSPDSYPLGGVDWPREGESRTRSANELSRPDKARNTALATVQAQYCRHPPRRF